MKSGNRPSLSKSEEDKQMERQEKAVEFLERKMLSKACGRALSDGVGDLTHPEQRAQLEKKTLPRALPLQGYMIRDPDWQCVSISLYDRYRQMSRMSGTGPTNFRAEFMICMGDMRTRAITSEISSSHRQEMRDHFYPHQVGVGEPSGLIKMHAAAKEWLRSVGQA